MKTLLDQMLSRNLIGQIWPISKNDPTPPIYGLMFSTKYIADTLDITVSDLETYMQLNNIWKKGTPFDSKTDAMKINKMIKKGKLSVFGVDAQPSIRFKEKICKLKYCSKTFKYKRKSQLFCSRQCMDRYKYLIKTGDIIAWDL